MIQPSIFISYSRKDEAQKDKLLSHLGVLQNAGLITVWSDDRISAGADWRQAIRDAMAQAKVAVLLVSANFLTSDFILDDEAPRLLKRRRDEGLVVVPIIATACAWRMVDWLASLQVRPKNGRPVWSDGGSHVDEDLAEIAEEIAQLVRAKERTPQPSASLKPARPSATVSVQTLDDPDWDSLLYRIKTGMCTPFIGPEVNRKIIQADRELALAWAREHTYPLPDAENLPRVAQYLAVKRDLAFPADEVARLTAIRAAPDFSDPDEPHSFLASLPLPLYLTTNYDHFMVQALRHHQRQAHQEVCRWNRYIPETASVFEATSAVEISPLNPVVYHLYGHINLPESMVLTEDNYLDFLVNISRQPVIPRQIEKALVRTSLLFVGYDLTDFRFRILFRGLVAALQRNLRRTSIAVQLVPQLPDGRQINESHVRNYLQEYLAKDDVRIYWGDSFDFIKELRARWEAYS